MELNLDAIDERYELSRLQLESDESLIYWLKYHVENIPDQVVMHIITGRKEYSVDFKTFEKRVRALAVELIKKLDKGDRAILMFDSDENFAISFFACLYAGVIAVPVYPPQGANKKHFNRLANITKDADAKVILTTRMIKPILSLFKGKLGAKEVIGVDSVKENQADQFAAVDRGAHELAFLQYTSGSTGDPKGVMVSHKNLVANQKAILVTMIEMEAETDSIVSWLPMYHDMGLIGGLLSPLYRGGKGVFMSPLLFLKKPELWLQAISDHKATVTAAPDFAYRLCTQRISDETLAKLDLSSLDYMLSGAEPVREDTLRKFCERFAPAGFRSKAITPCYGLAESTLYVTGTDRDSEMTVLHFDSEALEQHQVKLVDENHPNATKLVGNGQVAYKQKVQITEFDSTQIRADGFIGEILVSGESVTQGYWRKPEVTAQTFITIDGENGAEQWVRTGDLGFFHNDELFVTGRIKDIVILNGRNYYPQDIEQGVESEVSVIKPGRSIAFSVETPEGKEGVGIAVEVTKPMQKMVNPQALIEELNNAVVDICQQPADVVLLLNPKSIPKTSSGKLQRSACKKEWLANELNYFAKQEFGTFTKK